MEQCRVTAAEDKGTRTLSLHMTSGLQEPVARQHPWSPCSSAEYVTYPNRVIQCVGRLFGILLILNQEIG